jgi:hypothetical protein
MASLDVELRSAPDRALALLALRPVTASVDMTSTVKYHEDARIGRAVAVLGPAPDCVDAGVIGSGALGLSGGILR